MSMRLRTSKMLSDIWSKMQNKRNDINFWLETLRYLIFGMLTVAVNISAYHFLTIVFAPLVANTIAFFIAVLFAYWTNSTFVFQTGCSWRSFSQFMLMRIGTLLIDNGGMWLMLSAGWNDLFAKCVVNVVIIVINYLVSKLLIFRKRRRRG